MLLRKFFFDFWPSLCTHLSMKYINSCAPLCVLRSIPPKINFSLAIGRHYFGNTIKKEYRQSLAAAAAVACVFASIFDLFRGFRVMKFHLQNNVLPRVAINSRVVKRAETCDRQKRVWQEEEGGGSRIYNVRH
jgi:hypothetical protein